jgi:hypothetical protein
MEKTIFDTIRDHIDDAVRPRNVGPQKAIEILEEVAEHVRASIEALREENPELE